MKAIQFALYYTMSNQLKPPPCVNWMYMQWLYIAKQIVLLHYVKFYNANTVLG